MNISVNDARWLVDELSDQLKAGYKWGVLEYDSNTQQFEHVHFYYKSEQAEKFCDSISGSDWQVRMVKTSILQKLIEKTIKSDKKRDDIDYYVLDESSFSVSRILKVSSDQSPIHNPEGNWLTEELRTHIERHKNITSGEVNVVALNFGLLRGQLNRQGYDSDFFMTVEASMLRGAAKHEERYFSQYETETVMYDHLFIRNSEGHYWLDKITGTLYSQKEINHATINGINTRELENKILLDSNKDSLAILRAYGSIFQQLCDDPKGRVIAVQLYNNNVPFWMDKPVFISRVENEIMIYPKVNFPGETTRTQVYEGLKSYEEISLAMREYKIPDIDDEISKAALMEKLVNGKTCLLVAPHGPHQGEEVLFSWNWMSKELSFIFKDQLKLDARQYFTKTNSIELLPKMRVNGNKDKGMTL